jgi:uncharacterized membrane protein
VLRESLLGPRGSDRSELADRRVVVSAGAGAVAAVIAAVVGGSWSVVVLAGWDVAALAFTAWVWFTVVASDERMTAAIARSEDSQPAGEAMLVGAGGASGGERGFLTTLAIVSVVLGWISVHSVYLLRYARLYFSPPIGGIDFHGETPDYLDFAYLALTIGMTFQVSDTDLVTRKVRHAAIHHSLLSYLFGTVIVAVTINVVAGLLGR